jgi:hypothetical protein
VDIDAGAGAGQPALGAGQLQPGQDLLLRAVLAQPRFGRVGPGAGCELVDPRLELGQGALERVEAPALDARTGPDGERPGGYFLARWSIGT